MPILSEEWICNDEGSVESTGGVHRSKDRELSCRGNSQASALSPAYTTLLHNRRRLRPRDSQSKIRIRRAFADHRMLVRPVRGNARGNLLRYCGIHFAQRSSAVSTLQRLEQEVCEVPVFQRGAFQRLLIYLACRRQAWALARREVQASKRRQRNCGGKVSWSFFFKRSQGMSIQSVDRGDS